VSSGTKVATQDQQARSATRPQRPAPPGPLKPTRARRRPALIALGLALVALSVLGSVYLTTSLGKTYQVLAVTDAVARGSAISPGNITTVDLPTGPTALKPISADEFDLVKDRIATTDLKAGQLITRDSFAEELQPAPGQSIVGVALAPNQMPTNWPKSGDAVRIVETPATGGEPPAEAPFSIAATVVSTSRSNLGDQVVVDVQVASNNAAALAARAATGRVALVIDAVGAG